MRRYVGRSEGKQRDSREAAMGFGVAAGAMSQLYRLMAEAAVRLLLRIFCGRRW